MNTLLYVILTFCQQSTFNNGQYTKCVARVTECAKVFGVVQNTALTSCLIKEGK